MQVIVPASYVIRSVWAKCLTVKIPVSSVGVPPVKRYHCFSCGGLASFQRAREPQDPASWCTGQTRHGELKIAMQDLPNEDIGLEEAHDWPEVFETLAADEWCDRVPGTGHHRDRVRTERCEPAVRLHPAGCVVLLVTRLPPSWRKLLPQFRVPHRTQEIFWTHRNRSPRPATRERQASAARWVGVEFRGI